MSFKSFKHKLLKANNQIITLLSEVSSVGLIENNCLNDWKTICDNIMNRLDEEIVRIAVVGPIKSGKSTFVNSICKGEYLKRGAGVITSIVTRIQKDDYLKATLFFKSKAEVNEDIKNALMLFPNISSSSIEFDIDSNENRKSLQESLKTLNTDFLLTDTTQNPYTILISSYLNGYEKVKDIISSDSLIKKYKTGQFEKHKEFSGNETLAVYLKDIELKIPFDFFDHQIEIADCQGSDSPNPLHIAMIQDYLIHTHYIIYVISSRIGLRQADIKFLNIIKRMGILDNVLFVINFDFGEHESTNDLKNLVRKITDEISLIKLQPELYVFSALYDLFNSDSHKLTQKDRLRFEQWNQEVELVNYSKQQSSLFKERIQKHLRQKKFYLLLKNHVERLITILDEISLQLSVGRQMSSKQADEIEDCTKKIEIFKSNMHQSALITKNTIDGAVKALKKSLQNDIDRFFDPYHSQIGKELVDFIKNYSVSFQQESIHQHSEFTAYYYITFQEFKQKLDRFMIENIHPEIVRFIKETQNNILVYLKNASVSYERIFEEAFSAYQKTLESIGISFQFISDSKVELPNEQYILKKLELSFPSAKSIISYSPKMKTEAVLRLGFYKIFGALKRFFKKTPRNEKKEWFFALSDGLKKLKRESESSIQFHLKDYRENIKYQYFFKYIDALSQAYYETNIQRFTIYTDSLSKQIENLKDSQFDREKMLHELKELEDKSAMIHLLLKDIQSSLESTD